MASSDFTSSSEMMRPFSMSISSILPGCRRHFWMMLLFRHRQHAGFRRHDDAIVVGDEIARRTQAVAVERRADLLAVGEGDGGRTVPRLHQSGMIFVERLALAAPSAGCRPRLPGSASSRHAPANSRRARGIRARCRSRRCPTGLHRRSARAWRCRRRTAAKTPTPGAPPSS